MDKAFGDLLTAALPANIDALEKKIAELGLDQKFVDRIKKWQTNLLPTLVRATDPDCYPADFHTVLHGDVQLRNLLWKQDPVDVKFVRNGRFLVIRVFDVVSPPRWTFK